MSLENFYYGQGRLSIAVRDAVTKALGKWAWVGDVSAFSAKPTTQMIQHRESYSGNNSLTRNIAHQRDLALDWTFSEFRPENLATALYGTNITVATGTVTAESLGATVAVGDEIRTAHPGISALVVTDSTSGTPLVLVAGTDYIVDLTFGRIDILNIGTYVQPFKAAYSYAKRTDTGIFTAVQPDISVLYEGINLAQSNAGVIAEYYKVAPAPLTELMHITTGNDTAGMAIMAQALLDSTKPASGALGQFGRITQVGV
jgi:hypothetical protein